MSATSDKIVASCEQHWDAYKTDCSGFVKAVAKDFGIVLTGLADSIVDQIEQAPWKTLASGVEAAAKASVGLVVAGLKATPHGHVVIIVPGKLAHGKYPTGYWGQLGGLGKKNATINWAWNAADRDKVTYSLHQV